ncbi:hypothetical protein AGMMS4956_02160 [Bacteroidia bacterium]|nr:hypothetical protein AGMMS4956_02160 [Bacteroidia bacterium]
MKKKYLTVFVNFLLGRRLSRPLKIANYTISGIVVLYVILIAYPNPFFEYSYKYKNFKIHSTHLLGDSIDSILDRATNHLYCSEINTDVTHNIYFCNSFARYSFFAPISRRAFAVNYPIFNTIFIAKCDIANDSVYKNNIKDNYTKKLSGTIAHEATHTLIKEKIGLRRFIMLPKWKNEGYCEYIAHNNANATKEAKEYLIVNKNNHKLGADYRRYYYAVAYLIEIEKMSFDDIVTTNLSLEQVLEKIERLSL